jgi:secreted Zn-dependent insulinase-like peptidase
LSNLGARSHNFPMRYLLDESHLVNSFNMTALTEYAKGLDIEKALIFLPAKNLNYKNLEYKFLVKGIKKIQYEPWYRTNFTIYKVDFSKINSVNMTKTPVRLADEALINNLIQTNTNFSCDSKCMDSMRIFSLSEPSLLNKTNQFEFWYKYENTLDFKKTIVDVLFKYDKFENPEDRIHILLLETYLRRKIKKLNSKLKFLSNSISLSYNHHGMKISFSSFTQNVKEVTKELVEKIHIIQGKEKIKDFASISQELHDHLLKEYNAQPWSLSYEYLKKNVLKEYTTSEEYLRILAKTTLDDFLNFMNNKFHQKYYTKLLVIGDLEESQGREVFNEFAPILKVEEVSTDKSFKWSIKEKRKNRRVVLKNDSGNFLLRKEYHQEKNKNNVLVKCFRIGKDNHKNEVTLKLFNNLIGNIVFRELRINKQFGYVAKSKIELLENIYVSKFHYYNSLVLLHSCPRFFQITECD